MELQNGTRLLHWPLERHVVTAGYFYNNGANHSAIDLRTNQDGSIVKPVFAAESGTVDWLQTWDGKTKTGMQSYGTALRISHKPYKGKTLQTRYAHLSKIMVQKGETVAEGQLIGYTGLTGNTSGAHLHFEVILAGARKNPLVWLDSDFTTASAKVFTYQKGETPVKVPQKQSVPLYSVTVQGVTAGDKNTLVAAAQRLGVAATVEQV